MTLVRVRGRTLFSMLLAACACTLAACAGAPPAPAPERDVKAAPTAEAATGQPEAAGAQKSPAAAPVKQEPPAPDEPVPSGGRLVEDPQQGVRYVLPAMEGGWREFRDGLAARGVRVETGSFPLGAAASAITCRDTARSRVAALGAQPGDRETEPEDDAGGPKRTGPPEPLRDQAVSDGPVAWWSFTRGAEGTAVRGRWAFYTRGADCLMLEVTFPAGDAGGDKVFDLASRSHRLLPLTPDRQRDLDLLGGMRLLEQREPSAALDRFEALAAREPQLSRARFGALMAGYELGPATYARAPPHGEAVLAGRELAAEQRQLALRAVGVMQLAQGKLQAAQGTLAELVVRSPDLAEGRYNYACVLARLGDAPGAVEHLRAAVQIDPGLAAHAQADDDLASLRGSPAFEALVKPAATKAKR
jgi:hypothetical protein